MKYVIRTSDQGARISAAVVEEKKKAVRERILAAGMHYLEYPALLGTENMMGQAIAEDVVIIEPIGEVNYA